MARTRNCFFCGISEELNPWSTGTASTSNSKWQGATPNAIKQGREETEGYIASLQQHIDSLDQAIETLKQKRSEILLDQQRHQNLLSPIYTLPPELFTLTFTLCLNEWLSRYMGKHPSDTSEESAPRRVRDRWRVSPRYTITRVCHYWRDLVLESPSLWCDIEITEYLGSFSNGNQRLAHELTLSKGLPLRVWSFDDDAEDLTPNNKSCVPVTRQLGSSASRWVSFKAPWLCDFFILCQGLDPDSRPKFPLLRSLSGATTLYNDIFYNLCVADAPSLVNLELEIGDYDGAINVPPVIPWSQLRDLRLRTPPPSFMLAILPQLTSLTRLYLQPSHYEGSLHPSLEPVFLPCVDTLELDIRARESISLLRLPALKTLSCRALPTFAFDPIIRMLEATPFPTSPQKGVQTLELIDLDFESDFNHTHFVNLFQQLPNLKTLIMKENTHEFFFNPPLDALSMTDIDMLCPALEHLSLNDGSLCVANLECFISDRLKQERESEKGLLHLVLDRSCRFLPSSEDGFEGLVRGLRNFVERPGALLYADIILELGPGPPKVRHIQCSGRFKNLTITSTDH